MSNGARSRHFLYVDRRSTPERWLHVVMHAQARTEKPSNQRISLALPPQTLFQACRARRRSLAAVLGLAACGSDSGGSGEDATAVINETFSSKKDVNSGKLDMSVTANLEGTGAAAQLDEPVSIKLAGPFQSRGNDALPEVDLDLSVSGGGQTFTAGALTTGDAAFISYQGTDYRVPESQFQRYKRQIERDARRDKNRATTSTSRSSASTRATGSRTPRTKGPQDVGGAQTIHVSADVDVAAFVNDLDDLLGRAASLGVQNQQLPTRADQAPEEPDRGGHPGRALRPVDRRGGQDPAPDRGRVRLRPAQGPAAGRAGRRSAAPSRWRSRSRTSTRSRRSRRPRDARPLSELQSSLGVGRARWLLGGSGGGSSGGSSGSGSSGGRASPAAARRAAAPARAPTSARAAAARNLDSERSQRYLDCLGKAKQPADIEKCAAILEE